MWYSAVGSIGTLLLSLLAVPLAAVAQPPGKVYRIGYLGTGAPAPTGGRRSSSSGMLSSLCTDHKSRRSPPSSTCRACLPTGNRPWLAV